MNRDRLNHYVGIGFVNLATLSWASNMVFGRMLKDSIGPIAMASVRFLVASAIFALLLRQRPVEDRQIGKDIWPLAAMALTGVVLFSPMLYLGLRYTTAVNGSMINSFAPLLTGLFACWLIHQPMSARQISGAILAFIGVLILMSGGSLSFWLKAQWNVGDLYVLAAATIWALYSVISSKVMKGRSSISATALSTFIGLPLLCVLAIWEMQHMPVVLNIKVILLTIYLGVIPGSVGFYAWNVGVARLGASGAMIFYNTLPLYGALLSFLFLGEPIGLAHLAGGLLIVCGGIWSTCGQRPQLPTATLENKLLEQKTQ